MFAAAAELSADPIRPKPKLFLSCGTDDHNYELNCLMRDHLFDLGFDLVWEEAPGCHEWGFWDNHILGAIKSITCFREAALKK